MGQGSPEEPGRGVCGQNTDKEWLEGLLGRGLLQGFYLEPPQAQAAAAHASFRLFLYGLPEGEK